MLPRYNADLIPHGRTYPCGMANVVQPYGKAHRRVVAHRTPNPQIGSPVGNQACIVAKAALRLAFAKTPSP